MSTTVALVLFFLVALAAWLAWRYLHLLRTVREIAELVHPHAAAWQLQDISGVVRAFAEDLNRKLSILGAERDRLAAVLDQMTDGVLIADGNGQVQL